MSKELTAEQAQAYLAAHARLEKEIEEATYPVTLTATRARLRDQLEKLEGKNPEYANYTEEELARAIYGDDYI